MDRDTAYEMVRTFGRSAKAAFEDRGIDLEPMSDLMFGLGSIVKLEITDHDVPGITDALQLVVKDVSDVMFDEIQEAING